VVGVDAQDWTLRPAESGLVHLAICGSRMKSRAYRSRRRAASA